MISTEQEEMQMKREALMLTSSCGINLKMCVSEESEKNCLLLYKKLSSKESAIQQEKVPVNEDNAVMDEGSILKCLIEM